MTPNTVRVGFDKSHTSPWEVYYYRGGKKDRLARRKTKKEAEALRVKFQDEINKRGTDEVILSTAQKEEFLRAKTALGWNVSLDIVVASYLDRAKKPSIALSTAKDAFLNSLVERKLAAVSVRDYRGKLELLVEKFPTAMVEYFSDPPGEESHPLLKFILGVSENSQTRVHYRTKIGTFFRWCQSRNWLSVHPNRWIELGKVHRGTPPVYSPQQAETILRLFEKRCPRLVP